jgi:hypothetical protein
VHRFWVIPCLAAVLLASGCLGSSAAHAPAVAPPPTATVKNPDLVHPTIPPLGYALFQISGSYTTGGGKNHFTGKLHHERFVLACHSRMMYEELSLLSPQDRLCFAILDYQTAPRRDIVCACPVEIDAVSVRGEIQGRRIDERFSSCLCGDGKRAGRDALAILKTHPPF